jgi:apolipoprotein D and lipocalin family protein
VFYQKDDTLAVAEYSPGKTAGTIGVLNRAVAPDGNVVDSISGTAKLMQDPPPGRLKVSFPGIPAIIASLGGPNYHVIWVSADYNLAIVGIPSRSMLWILARDPLVARGTLSSLIARAESAGFDTSRLIVAPWTSEAVRQFKSVAAK